MSGKHVWLLLVSLVLVLSACGTIVTPERQVNRAATDNPSRAVRLPTASTVPPSRTPTATQTPAVSPVRTTALPGSLPPPTRPPEPAPTRGISGNAANGQALFNTFQPATGFACATCHHSDSEDRLIGPGLLNIGTRAATRIGGQSAFEYIHTSIVNPGAFVVEEFPDGLMPQNWAEVYSEDQINDIIAYLLTLG